ncbi:hypothetical protein CVT26_005380 [Gymnopilus dilepis]|uniref:Uncharacterized protein n=1 Tax=Gymnopilus dilepis TaxID=231916 RepID=A0A409WC34_9AGAR|nr:hypothetical protein CVT26_005380 [Gymnopilus dilepis]
MSVQKPLPPTFRSLYRLFLRTASASVLHQSSARQNLRARWRPIFDEGAKVTQEFQNKSEGASPEWIRSREIWLNTWNKRLDHTLELLYNSSQTRGQPHKITRNLAFITGLERRRIVGKFKRLPRWDPTSKKYEPLTPAKLKALHKKNDEEKFQDHTLKALDEVIRMAEAFSGLTLGRNDVTLRRMPEL